MFTPLEIKSASAHNFKILHKNPSPALDKAKTNIISRISNGASLDEGLKVLPFCPKAEGVSNKES
jgi:hypothetical protein